MNQTIEPEKLNAHVIAKINDDYYKTSKVIIEKTNSIKINKCLNELKKILTYESQKNKVSISYNDINEKYEDRLQVIKINITHLDKKMNTPYRNLNIYDYVFQDIIKAIPNGFKFHGIDTSIFFHDKKDSFIIKDNEDSLSIELTMTFMKETKYKF